MIIAFGNKARHGKDTCCQAILDFYNDLQDMLIGHGLYKHKSIQVKRVNFADALRKEVTDATKAIFLAHSPFAINEEAAQILIEGMKMPSWVTVDPNPIMDDPLLPYGKHSKILQWWGTEYRRAQDPDYWVKKWKEQIQGFDGIVVTADLRFLNEAKAVKDLGGYAVNVSRFNADGTPYRDLGRPADHISEMELDGYNWDFRLANSHGHLALLGEQAITLVEYLRGLSAS